MNPELLIPLNELLISFYRNQALSYHKQAHLENHAAYYNSVNPSQSLVHLERAKQNFENRLKALSELNSLYKNNTDHKNRSLCNVDWCRTAVETLENDFTIAICKLNDNVVKYENKLLFLTDLYAQSKQRFQDIDEVRARFVLPEHVKKIDNLVSISDIQNKISELAFQISGIYQHIGTYSDLQTKIDTNCFKQQKEWIEETYNLRQGLHPKQNSSISCPAPIVQQRAFYPVPPRQQPQYTASRNTLFHALDNRTEVTSNTPDDFHKQRPS